PGSLGRLRFLVPARFLLHRLLFHPLVQFRFLEAPAVAQLERGNALLIHVLVERVRTHPQVLRRLANVHHFSRVGHSSLSPAAATAPALLTGAEEIGRTISSIAIAFE